MERTLKYQQRLVLPMPYLVFCGVPRDAAVHARVHGWRNEAAQLYAMDYGLRPAAFTVPNTGVPPLTAVTTRIPASLVFMSDGGPVAPGPREPEYIYQYIWTAFAPAVAGTVVPHGKATHAFAMPFTAPGGPEDEAVLRFRWRGNTVKAAWNTGVAGTGIAGPYTIDLSGAGANVLPIIPGTVVIVAPTAAGFATARDWPWPTAVEQQTCLTGRMVGDVSPTVDSVINYETGAVTITFNQNIAVAPNIAANFEHDGTLLPLDIAIDFDANAQ